VLADQPTDSRKVVQVVWKIVYDEKDTEQMRRQEIIVALKSHVLKQHHDIVGDLVV
jgi:hypothetical protein